MKIVNFKPILSGLIEKMDCRRTSKISQKEGTILWSVGRTDKKKCLRITELESQGSQNCSSQAYPGESDAVGEMWDPR